MSTLNQNMSNAQHRAQDTFGAVKDVVQDAAGEFRRTAQERLSQARDSASHYLQEGRDRAMEVERAVESRIRHQPLQSLLIASGIGFLLGVLFVRR
jgi:ElaB/YqjD/DUF883 family membrane-anchored ribosome-binding protein